MHECLRAARQVPATESVKIDGLPRVRAGEIYLHDRQSGVIKRLRVLLAGIEPAALRL